MATNKRFVAKNGLDNNSQTITNVADPVNAQDVATKTFSSNASNLTSGTIASAILGNSTVYIGTTAVLLNRASASLALTGVSIDGAAGSVAASALTGSTLASGVTASSLTSLGTLSSLQMGGTLQLSLNTLSTTSYGVALKETVFGYSSSYKALLLGFTGATRALSFGYDPSVNPNASFTGNEIIFRNAQNFIMPNSTDNGWYSVLQISATGGLTIPQGLTVSGGTVTVPSGQWLSFGATALLYADATNTLIRSGTTAFVVRKADNSADYFTVTNATGAATFTGTVTVNAGLDADTTASVGNGGASPTANRVVTLYLNAPSTTGFLGQPQIIWRRNSVDKFGLAMLNSTAGPMLATTDLALSAAGTPVASFTTTGQLRTAGGFYTSMNGAQAMQVGSVAQANSGVMLSTAITAASGAAMHTYVYAKMTAAANSDGLTSLRVEPVITPGAFTGIASTGLYIVGWSSATWTSPGQQTGVQIGAITGTGATTAVSVNIGDVTGATNNYAIYTGLGKVRLGDQLWLADGTNTAPGIAFSAATGVGLYRTGAASMAVSSGVQFGLQDGSTTAPSLNFANAGSLGFYRVSTTQIGVTSGSADTNVTFNIGIGGAAPTANRGITLTLDSPDSVTWVGSAYLKLARNGTAVWYTGIDSSTTGAAQANTDHKWQNSGGTNLAALTTGGQLRTAGGFYTTASSQFGIMGIGTAPQSRLALYIAGTITATSGAAWGLYQGATMAAAANSDALTSGRFDTTFSTGTFTGVVGYGLLVQGFSTASWTSPGNPRGVEVGAITGTGATYAYGLLLGNVSGATNNYAIQTGTGKVLFGDTVAVGATVSSAAAVNVQNITLTGTTQVGYQSYATMGSGATTAGKAFYGAVNTTAAAYTMAAGYGLHIDVPTVGAGSAITTQYGAYLSNQGASGITNAYGVYIVGPSGAATVNMGLFNGGTSRFEGAIGQSTDPSTTIAHYVRYTTSGATSQYGGLFQAIANSACTTAFTGLRSEVITQAAAFTLASGYALFANTPTIGSGSAVTTVYGVYAANQGTTGVTNAYGVYIAAQSGAATTNIGLYNGGTTQLNGSIGVGVAPVSQIGLNFNGFALSGSSTQQAISSTATYGSAATTAGYGVAAKITTAAAVFTMADGMAFIASSPTIGAGSAITNSYGFYASNMGASGVTNAYGVYIAAQSGAATTNYGFYNAGTSYHVGTTRMDGVVGINNPPTSNTQVYLNSTLAPSGGASRAMRIDAAATAGANSDTLYGLHLSATTLTPGAFTGTIAYGLYIGSVSGAATNYAIYSSATAASVLSGSLSAAGLTVTGNNDIAMTANYGLSVSGTRILALTSTTATVGGTLAVTGTTTLNTVTYTWPSVQGGSGTVLTNNGSGTLTWSTSSGGGIGTRMGRLYARSRLM